MDQIVIKRAGHGRVEIELPIRDDGSRSVVADSVLLSLASTLFFAIFGIIQDQEDSNGSPK